MSKASKTRWRQRRRGRIRFKQWTHEAFQRLGIPTQVSKIQFAKEWSLSAAVGAIRAVREYEMATERAKMGAAVVNSVFSVWLKQEIKDGNIEVQRWTGR